MPSGVNRDRRRFLRQLSVGCAGLGLVGSVELAHGQSLAVDFGRLDRHPVLTPSPATAAANDATPTADGALAGAGIDANAGADSRAGGAADDLLGGFAADSDAFDSADSESEAPAELVADAELITENRALWLDSGYLILIRWTRLIEDSTAVATFEGLADDVGVWLSSRVTNVDHLHNLDQLHPIEADLLVFVNLRVSPAVVETLHIDHDCTQVCSLLNPSRTYPEIYDVDGGMAMPDWD